MPARAGSAISPGNYKLPEAAPAEAVPPPTETGCGCNVTGVPCGVRAPQQLQVQGGQASPGAQAGQAQPHPPVPEPPPSTGGTGFIWEQAPVGHGVVMHTMVTEVQPHASAVSAVQEVTSVCAVQGSAGGGAPQSQGAQAAPAGQAGQVQTTVGDPVLPVLPVTVPDPDAPPLPEEVVVVAPSLQAQLQAGQSAPAGHSGQLQVQVPVPLPPPVTSPQPPVPPPPPALPPAPPVPQVQSQGGQTSPAGQAGQPQVQVPPPPALPPSAACGGGQSHCTGGQAPLAGQASGCTQRQPFTVDPRSKQKPPPSQL